jgi:hypothetical protein
MSAGGAIIELHDEVTYLTVVEQVVELIEIADFSLATDRIPASLATAEGQIPVSLAVASWSKVTAPTITGQFLQSDLGVSGKMKWAASIMGSDGWITAGAWTYASAITVTVASGAAAIYSVGNPVRWKEGGAYKYGYIVAVADTQLTIAGNTFAGGAITDNYFSLVTEPVGFPVWFAYTPTGGPTTNNTQTGRFTIEGRTLIAYGRIAFTGAPAAWTNNPTLPVAASANLLNTTPLGIAGWGSYRDSGTATVLNGVFPEVLASGTTVLLFKADGTAFSLTVAITWANGDFIEYYVQYEI